VDTLRFRATFNTQPQGYGWTPSPRMPSSASAAYLRSDFSVSSPLLRSWETGFSPRLARGTSTMSGWNTAAQATSKNQPRAGKPECHQNAPHPAIELAFRSLSKSPQVAPKDWADSYVSAFAQVSGLRLVTFDQALQSRTAGSLLKTIVKYSFTPRKLSPLRSAPATRSILPAATNPPADGFAIG
jgi:hypothetical protein